MTSKLTYYDGASAPPMTDPRVCHRWCSNRNRRCRKCGGAFLGTSCEKAAIPELDYPDPVWVCNPCNSGSKRCSRWIVKVPKSQRGVAGKAREIGKAADAVAETLGKAATAIGSVFSVGGAQHARWAQRGL